MSDGISSLDHAREAQFTCDTCGTSYKDQTRTPNGTCPGCKRTWCGVDQYEPGDIGVDDPVVECAGCGKYHHIGCMTESEVDEELRCAGCAAKEKTK